jgi:hypothetical protein
MLTLTLAIALSQAAAGAASAEPVISKGSTAMTASEIRAYNANFKRNDPQYIRCERSLVTGSLVKKHTSCRTNAEWQSKDDLGNKEARDFVDDAKMGGTSGPG